MIKLKDLLLEKGISFYKPNFEFEWEEAIRYPELKPLGKKAWVELAKNRKEVKYSEIKDDLANVDLNFDKLETPKKQRFQLAFKKGVIETPIALRNPDWVKEGENEYDVLGGNTRIAGLVKHGIDPVLWVVDIG
tara:strand:+ start:91 stop:492 length:402 start_codon:yes stop_codon:yes gene_type:complete